MVEDAVMAESVYGVCNPPGRLSAAGLQGGCVLLRASRLPAPEVAFATALSARSVPLCLVRPASFPASFGVRRGVRAPRPL